MLLRLLLFGEGAAATASPHAKGPLVPAEQLQCTTVKADPITEALDADGRPRSSRFYSVKNVCVAPRPECGARLDAGFDDDQPGDFDPLHALRQWVDLFESGCASTFEAVHKVSTGLAFTVQHNNAYNQDSIQHQAAALLAMFGNTGEDTEVQSRLARVTSMVLPQYASREQLHGQMQWLMGMLGLVLPKCVLPNKCKEGRRELNACAELAEPVCYDELIVHRQVGLWSRRTKTRWSASHSKQQQEDSDRRSKQLFADASDVRRFQWRAASTLHLPTCLASSEKLTVTLAVRRDARGYANWDEIIGKTTELVEKHPPWTLELWEPKPAEDLAGQAQRLSCTDLLITVQGTHAANMIFMPPRAGVLFTARCGCKYQSGFMHELASQLGLRWWDALEDCTSGQTNSSSGGECSTWNEHGKLSTVLSDFEANWERPLSRALVALRKPNSTKGGMWRPKLGKDTDSKS